jgi:hypothetical protein
VLKNLKKFLQPSGELAVEGAVKYFEKRGKFKTRIDNNGILMM